MIVEAIAKYIVENNIDIAALAEKIGLKKRNLHLILKGNRKLSLDDYEKICIACNVPYEYFFANHLRKNDGHY